MQHDANELHSPPLCLGLVICLIICSRDPCQRSGLGWKTWSKCIWTSHLPCNDTSAGVTHDHFPSLLLLLLLLLPASLSWMSWLAPFPRSGPTSSISLTCICMEITWLDKSHRSSSISRASPVCKCPLKNKMFLFLLFLFCSWFLPFFILFPFEGPSKRTNLQAPFPQSGPRCLRWPILPSQIIPLEERSPLSWVSCPWSPECWCSALKNQNNKNINSLSTIDFLFAPGVFIPWTLWALCRPSGASFPRWPKCKISVYWPLMNWLWKSPSAITSDLNGGQLTGTLPSEWGEMKSMVYL